MIVLGRFLDYQKCNIRISYKTGTRASPDIYTLTLSATHVWRHAHVSGKALLPVI